MKAHTSSQYELGYPIEKGMIFRITPFGEPRIPAVIPVGAIIKTNYGAGPYKVKEIIKNIVMSYETYSFICMDINNVGRYYLNEFVAIDGRILKLFGNNNDEIFIVKAEGQLSLL